MSFNLASRGLVLGCALMALGAMQSAQAQTGASGSLNVDEQKAIQIVRNWTTALSDEDADRMISYMADDVEFRGDSKDAVFTRGRAAVLRMFNAIFEDDKKTHEGVMGAGGVPILRIKRGPVKIVDIYAIGGPEQVVVIAHRIDTFKVADKENDIPVGVFFRVDPKAGKILECVNVALTKLSVKPPAAAVPPGAPPPGTFNPATPPPLH